MKLHFVQVALLPISKAINCFVIIEMECRRFLKLKNLMKQSDLMASFFKSFKQGAGHVFLSEKG